MPKEYKTGFFADSMLKTIESSQKAMKNRELETLSEEKKRETYAVIFASRSAVNAVRGKKSTLKAPADVKVWEKKRNELIQSFTFQSFITAQGHQNIQKLLLEGHGGAAEEAFEKYVLGFKKLPTDVPERSMPTAWDRIEQQQKKLEALDAGSDQAIDAYAEIFRARRAVGAIRGKGDSLKVKINGQLLAQQPDLANNNAFRTWVKKNPVEVKQAMTKGHAGAAEELFQEHLKTVEHIPGDAPDAYLPTGLDRTAELVAKIKKGGSDEEQKLRCIELIATRQASGAVRGDKKSLDTHFTAASLKQAYDQWSRCETFTGFLERESEKALAGAKQGHGGALSDAFKEHVLHLDHIPEDVPDDHMPNADKRLEALQEKFKSEDYYISAPERQLELAAEIMATREAVEAVRGDRKTLEKPVSAKVLAEKAAAWKNCKAFQNFVREQPEKVRDGAAAGHGGKLGDNFKQYVNELDELDNSIPADYMPSARVRLEAIQNQIRKGAAEDSPEKLGRRYAELIATRSAVNAERKNAKTLDTAVDGSALAEAREKLLASETFQRFLNDETQADALRKAALDGHGGALEDKFKEYVKTQDAIGADVPVRFMPDALERTEALQTKIREGGEADSADLFAELLATREAVGAVRGKKDSLKVTVDPASLAAVKEKWSKCESFRSYVSDLEPEEARTAALSGHGGALLDKFREHVRSQEYLPEDLPDAAIPTAEERIDAIKDQIKDSFDFMEPDERCIWIAQILAARTNVNAVRKTPDTLKTKLDPTAVTDASIQLIQCGALAQFIESDPKAAKSLATSGHGGEFEEKFRDFVRGMDVLPNDLPIRYAPTAMKRIEGLQKKLGSKDFDQKTPEEKIAAYAELIGTRRSVNAGRNQPETLNINMDPAKAKAEAKKLTECSAFQDFVKQNPAAVKNAARSGHGGALEDAFKKYVLNLDKIPEDVPKEFMPNARERTEVLQKKIDSSAFLAKSEVEQDSLYRELMATRASVNSVRGEKETLDHTVDPQKLQSVRSELTQSHGADDFFSKTDRPALRKAALKGHGGALEDQFKEHVIRHTVDNGLLPDHLPGRYQPKVSELRERLRESFTQDLKTHTAETMNLDKDRFKKKVAASMYLTMLEKKAAPGAPKLDAAEMEKSVNKLANSNAFKKMFEQSRATQTIVTKIAAKRMSEVLESYSTNGGRFEEPQPALQNQRENQRENQLENQQNPRQRQRANSVNQRQNRPEQPEAENENPQRNRRFSVRNRENQPGGLQL